MVSQCPLMVIDDGSSDGLQIDDLSEIHYLNHEANRGKGAALKTGFNSAKETGFTHAITLDADGQHDPDMIPDFLAKSNLNPFSMIVGRRDLRDRSMPFHRKLSNQITSLILSLRTGQLIRDAQVGYRCYPLYDSRLWDSDEEGFQFESDIFFRANKLKMNFVWQKIPVIYGDEASHMKLVRDTMRFVRTFARSFAC